MHVVKIPSDSGGLRKQGSSKAPHAIEKALDELFLNEDGKDSRITIEEVAVDKSNIETTNDNIFAAIKAKGKAIILGGDHSITYPAFKAFIENNPGAGLVVFDAHPDCEHFFTPPTHEDYLRTLIAEGTLDPQKVVLIGIRNWHGNELQFLREKNIKHFTMKEVFDRGVQEVCDAVMFVAKQWPAVYLSIDIDAVDPAFAPGTGYQEPGGLSSRELLYFLQRLRVLPNLKMVDIVEIDPHKDVAGITVKLGAKIVKELA